MAETRAAGRGGGCVLVPGQRRLAFTSSKIPKKIEEEKKRKKTYRRECPESGHKSTEIERENFEEKELEKKTYMSECPDNVDCNFNLLLESMTHIFTELSQLPLASVPSMLHATDITL